MYLHDTHFHLDLSENPEKTIRSIENAKIYTIAVTNLPDLFENTLNLTKGMKYVRASLGFHPELAASYQKQLDLFEINLPLTRYIGEIGLDNYNKTKSDYALQKKAFEKIINLSHLGLNKILTIHSRRAEKDVISIIGENFSGKVILHWYSGNLRELERAISFGYYFSVNHAMCMSEHGQKIIRAIPENKILLESDGPFIKLYNDAFTPLDISIVSKKIFQIRNNATSEIAFIKVFQQNFETLVK